MKLLVIASKQESWCWCKRYGDFIEVKKNL